MDFVHLQLQDISKYYISGREVTAALNEVSLELSTGEFVAVTGESGSGKSTLAHILAGILPFERGKFLLNGQSTLSYSEEDWQKYRLEKVSFIAQNYGILPGNTVLENVVSILRLIGLEPKEALQHAEKLLRQVELWKFRKRRAAKLSSGQKQRLSIARALAKPSPILIADEPTSNLDRSNGRKIIKLLSDAAKERLVIMVTHDFNIVEEYVTRQITLHDGTIESDTLLESEHLKSISEKPGAADMFLSKKSSSAADTSLLEKPATADTSLSKESISAADTSLSVDPSLKTDSVNNLQTAKNQTRLGWYIARLQLRARPAWTFFMTVFFVLTAFAVFTFLGTFIISLDDTSTRIYDNEAFRNGNNRRLVVTKPDHSPLSQEDYTALLSVNWAEALEPWDVIADVNYFYRLDVDYGYRYIEVFTDIFSSLEYKDSVIFTNYRNFVQTVPLLAGEREFLTAGRLPEHMNEIVAVGGKEMLGEEMPVFILDAKNWAVDSCLCFNMTVVGVTDYGQGLYFDERIGKMLNQYFASGFYNNGILYGVNDELSNSEVTVTKPFKEQWISYYKEPIEVLFCPNMNDLGNRDAALWLDYAGTNFSQNLIYREVSEEVFDQLNFQQSCVQASLYLKDYSYTDRAIQAVQDLGYEVVSPYRVSSVKQDAKLADARLTTLVFCLLALAVVIMAQILVLSTMFGLEMKNYGHLSDLGLSCRVGKISILWQVLLLTAIGQVIGFFIILAGSKAGVQRFYNILKYLAPAHITAICLLHLAASLLVVLAVCRMLRRQVFPFIRRSFEIDLSEIPEEENLNFAPQISGMEGK